MYLQTRRYWFRSKGLCINRQADTGIDKNDYVFTDQMIATHR